MVNLLVNVASNSGLFHNIITILSTAGVLLLIVIGVVPRKQWRRLKVWLRRHHIKWVIVKRTPKPIPVPRTWPPKTIPIPKPPVE